ncbi:MAG: Gfo/Idh/MocA family oxidoreductase, partial [Propionicimonas sp.]|nr:Gfo/Idh/MocA family oxidoreductase [Propionicimonas sp.]
MIRTAAIGTSMISHRFAAAVQQVPGIELTCVYSRDAERAAAVATELGAAWSSPDLSEVLASDAIDAVYVASPNTVHHEQVLAAIRAGKHV